MGGGFYERMERLPDHDNWCEAKILVLRNLFDSVSVARYNQSILLEILIF